MAAIGLFWFAFSGPAQVVSPWASIVALAFSMCGMVLIFECGIIYLIDSESKPFRLAYDPSINLLRTISVERRSLGVACTDNSVPLLCQQCNRGKHNYAIPRRRDISAVHTVDGPESGLSGPCFLALISNYRGRMSPRKRKDISLIDRAHGR